MLNANDFRNNIKQKRDFVTPSWHFDGPNGVRDIDVTLCNCRMAAKYSSNWRCTDGCPLSDHNPIFIDLVEYQRSEMESNGATEIYK